jgi:hypothetical protein
MALLWIWSAWFALRKLGPTSEDSNHRPTHVSTCSLPTTDATSQVIWKAVSVRDIEIDSLQTAGIRALGLMVSTWGAFHLPGAE